MAAIGTLAPSSNRIVERATASVLAALPGVTAHYARVPLTGDSSEVRLHDVEGMCRAAELLSHAKVDAICWSGTRGAALGFDADVMLCSAMHAPTGVPTTTASLATLELLRRRGARRIALVTPFTADYQSHLIEAFAAKGIAVASERHLGLTDNFYFASVSASAVAGMIRAAAAEAPVDATLVFCTNFDGAPIAAAVEAEIDRIVIDRSPPGFGRSFAPPV
jgi:maleate isomerase